MAGDGGVVGTYGDRKDLGETLQTKQSSSLTILTPKIMIETCQGR